MPNVRMRARQAIVRAMYAGLAATNKRRRYPTSRKIKRILVLRPDHLGDLLFATPSLDMIAQAWPQAHITGAVGPWGSQMWADDPNLDALEIIPFPGIVISNAGPLEPYTLIGKVARKLAHQQYDLGIVLRSDHWWGAALLWASGVPHRWGYRTPGTAPWLTNSVPYTQGKHEVEQDLSLTKTIITAIGESQVASAPPNRNAGLPPLRPPDPTPPPTDLLSGWLASQHRIVLHPGTAAANKLWTISGWADVACKLSVQGWSVALTGAPDERRLADAIASASSAPLLNLAGQTANLAQLVWVLDHAHLVLGVDSGPLHIADALHKPTLHLYGPSDEQVWGPWGDPQTQRAFRAPGTRPTMRLEVGSAALEGGPQMRAISVEMVLREVRQLEETLTGIMLPVSRNDRP